MVNFLRDITIIIIIVAAIIISISCAQKRMCEKACYPQIVAVCYDHQNIKYAVCGNNTNVTQIEKAEVE